MIGLGTLINVLAIVLGSLIGTLIGSKFSKKTRNLVTDTLGLTTFVIAGLSIADIANPTLKENLGSGVGVLIILGSLILGGITGSILELEKRFENIGKRLKKRFAKKKDKNSTFVEGFVSASLVFVVGPLAILGSISDGLQNGIELLALKSSLDFFASIAFASSLGIGVMFSALAVGVYQALFTLLGVVLGNVLDETQVLILTVTGGLLLVGVALRLLKIKQVSVAELLPALIFAPILVKIWMLYFH